ncbi:MAG: sulfotransferase domain-containing protein [Pseudolabrys sp.]
MIGIVWLASYPKSGNTWLRLALESLMAGGAPVRLNHVKQLRLGAASRSLLEEVLGVDTSDLSHEEIEELRPRCYEAIARDAKRPLFMKVHDARISTAGGEPLFPPDITSAAIYIVRDPRDVAVSYAYHSGVSIDAMIGIMANPRYVAARGVSSMSASVPQRYLSWSAHVESWLDTPDMKILLLRYEDMVRDFATELGRVAAFLGMEPSPGAIAGAVAATRFERLQEAEASEGFRELAPTAARFFRKGVAGGWRTDLSDKQVRQIESDQGVAMKRMKYA